MTTAPIADPHGLDIIDHATAIIAAALRTAHCVVLDRAIDPAAHPEYGRDLGTKAIARRAVGELLAAGMLVTPLTPAEASELRRRNRQMRGQA